MLHFKIKRHVPLVIGVVLTAMLMGIDPVAGRAATPEKILLTPFAILGDKDLAYLQRGIEEMLASRLAQEGRVLILRGDTPAPKDQDDALRRAAKAGADYVLLGSLMVLGGRVSTDARVLAADTQKQVLAFGRSGAGISEVIDHMDQLAAEINSRLFGRVTPPPPVTPTVQIPKAAGPPPKERPSIYQHPEKLLADETEPEQAQVAESARGTLMAPLLLRSRKQDGQITGVTTGDVDGDGRVEIVTANTAGDLLVQRIDQGRWVKVAQIKGSGHFIGVDAADVNANGKAEIFVTNFDNRISKLDSFVLEWDGRSLQRTAQRLNWYFRTVDLPGRKRVLVGQRQGAADRFGAGIYEIGWQAGSYEDTQRLSLPNSLNVFGFGVGQVRAGEDTEVVAYNENGYVQILSTNGAEEWVTSERYGGSSTFIEFPDKMNSSETDYVYLNPRLHLFDLDGDGLQEILVVGNENSAPVLERTRFFKKGRLEWLKWDELGMRTVLRTRDLPKYIADFDLADLDGDGRPEMIAAIIQKESSLLDKGTSYLAVFGTALPSSKQK